MMGIKERVLPDQIEVAAELETQRRECMQTQIFLMKAMEKTSNEGNVHLYHELLALRNKEMERARKIEKELAPMYMEKQKVNRERERKEREDVLQVAKRLEEVSGRPEIVEKIRRNA
ncbi:hypothetical protein [Bacillus mobilis]|uniref:hypothetical protein n=1 Tax=Bacillus mobilis TaxID=2026190 RepID=UPI00330D7572|nr:hypothetical protein [Bacillus mobilis]